MAQNDTVQKIAAVLAKHRYWYDGFDQNTDCHQCGTGHNDTCRINGRSREEVEQHIARMIEMAISERKIEPSDDEPFWKAP